MQVHLTDIFDLLLQNYHRLFQFRYIRPKNSFWPIKHTVLGDFWDLWCSSWDHIIAEFLNFQFHSNPKYSGHWWSCLKVIMKDRIMYVPSESISSERGEVKSMEHIFIVFPYFSWKKPVYLTKNRFSSIHFYFSGPNRNGVKSL